MTRAEAAKKLCERLESDVDAITPMGIGRWDSAWEIAAASDAEFMIALTGWEADPTEGAKTEVRTAYNRVIAAWREAVRIYEAQRLGTP